ncbi:NAD(P)-binding protein [Fistulina hepatica ATCC 64428]|uniref:NAD(P)-binding protein n=1 Tax=Fistulina hepatica ATCC 64428 TaxID=1128425 RepID=A0A0D7A599_9AGAR|nr:NAD(P)-binding protein [Fistulina hepatica ATCC 64428]
MSEPKVWLITGANSGLGLALAQYVLAQGHKVIAGARNPSKIPASLKEAAPLEIDMNWPDSRIKEAGALAWKLYGHVDVLVNNAGYSLTGVTEVLKAEDVEMQFKTNVFGALSLTQALIPLMREVRSGVIFNLSSVAGFAGSPPFAAYNASKAALEAFTEATAVEVARFGIKAYIVEPGYFPTNFLSVAASTDVPSQVTQKFYPEYVNTAPAYFAAHVKSGQFGDAEKASARLFEIATGASPVKIEDTWRRIPLGPDCGKRVLAKIKLLQENVEGLEPVWTSTDMAQEMVQAKFGQYS